MHYTSEAEKVGKIRIDPASRCFGSVMRVVILLVVVLAPTSGFAADFAAAQKMFRSGKYSECIAECAAGSAASPWDTDWTLLKTRAEMLTGQYGEALKTLQVALARSETNIELRRIAVDVLNASNRPQEADRMLVSIRQLAVQNPGRYSAAEDRVVLGEALLKSGADPRQVLELFYDSAKKVDPASAVPYMASAELALDKQDFAIAATEFAEYVKRTPDDPDGYFGLSRAFENNAEQTNLNLAKALELNPKHVPSLLFQIDNLIDQEEYDKADELIKEVLDVNPVNAKALAYRAVISHLGGDRAKEEQYRNTALSTWRTNPLVDHTIGQKLAQKYRFAEGASYQRRALAMDPAYTPAKLQLANDLLRLGEEAEGWKLAGEVTAVDPYNVVAFNLATLHKSIDKFKTIQNEHFILRMDEREAQIYGSRVMKLLEDARTTLSKKYDVTLTQPITVEIFNQQKDFAIRTFGLPGGAGYLGVCFGNVVTVNSPATRGANPTNWEAVVWHEFCHVITLAKTKNKMPRWLSEGISVFEELEHNKSWGQSMNPQYRDLILQDKATPVSKLSGAFMRPSSPQMLNFAYYESNMVVQYIISRFGIESMKKVLTDLGNDVPINTALAKYTEPIEKLDANFDKWFKEQAQNLAPKADLVRTRELPLDADSTEMAAWNKEHPNNFWGLLGEGRALIAERKWAESLVPLQKAVEIYPTYGVAGGPYLLMAQAFKELGQTPAERSALEKHLAMNAEAIEPRMRLIEIASEQSDWKAVQNYTDQVLAINPLVPAPHRYMAQAAEQVGDRALAIDSRKTLLLMNPLDLADQHFKLAKLLMTDKQQLPEAKKQVVLALESAPRFLAAHQLLLDIAGKLELEPPPAAVERPAGANNLPVKPATSPSALPGSENLNIEERLRLRRQSEMGP